MWGIGKMKKSDIKIYLLNCIVTGLPFAKILSNYIAISGIITVSKEKSTNILEYYDYSEFCKEKGIDLIEVESYSLGDERDKNKLLGLNIDIIITAGWQRLIPEWLIKHCSIGAIGAHGSAAGITSGRGRSPQNWALLLGKSKFYLSIFWLDSGIDNGEIIDTIFFEYELIDDISISYSKMSIYLAKMIIRNLENGNIFKHYGKRQGGKVGYLPKRTPQDGMIDWSRKCKEIYNFVRALSYPYPGAFTKYKESIIKIYDCKFIETDEDMFNSYQSGEIIFILEKNRFWVKCYDGIVEIREYETSDDLELLDGMIFESCSFYKQMRNIVDIHNKNVGLPISDMILEVLGKE